MNTARSNINVLVYIMLLGAPFGVKELLHLNRSVDICFVCMTML